MAKVKYRYNPETLSYDIITISFKERLKTWGIMFAASVGISIIYFLIYSQVYDTPKELILTNNLSELRFNYQMLLQDLNEIDHTLSDIQKRDDNIYRTVLESEPIPSSVRQAGFGGVNRYESLEGYLNSPLMINATRHTDKILKQLYVQSVSYDELIEKALQKEQMTMSRPAILPIPKNRLRNTGRYGMRFHPIHKRWQMHTGMDFSAVTGTPVYATGDGRVIKSEYNRGGYGYHVVIDHGFGYRTLYAHLHTIGVLVDAEVRRGQQIGTVGSTGTSTSPHLHYEVHVNGRYVNPILYYSEGISHVDYIQLVEQAQNNEEIYDDWSNEFSDDDFGNDVNSDIDEDDE